MWIMSWRGSASQGARTIRLVVPRHSPAFLGANTSNGHWNFNASCVIYLILRKHMIQLFQRKFRKKLRTLFQYSAHVFLLAQYIVCTHFRSKNQLYF